MLSTSRMEGSCLWSCWVLGSRCWHGLSVVHIVMGRFDGSNYFGFDLVSVEFGIPVCQS